MNAVQLVRVTGIVEGVSWLLLLFVAMPLKYGFDYPQAVRVVGLTHGVLFTAFVLVLAYAHVTRGWSVRKSLIFFAAALVPFGFIFVDRRYA